MITDMPSIDLAGLKEILTPEEYSILRRCVSTQGKNAGHLRASKPFVDRHDPQSGKAAYVWRMLAFQLSPIGQHQCMPVTAEWDLPVGYEGLPSVNDPEYTSKLHDRHEQRRIMANALDELVDRVVNTIPPSEWHGVQRWARALGVTDRPQGELL